MLKPLDQRSDNEIVESEKRLADTEAQVAKNSAKMPGPGWDAVRDILQRGREEIEGEMRKRGLL